MCCFAASRFAGCRGYVRRWTLAAAAPLQPCRAAAVNGDAPSRACSSRSCIRWSRRSSTPNVLERRCSTRQQAARGEVRFAACRTIASCAAATRFCPSHAARHRRYCLSAHSLCRCLLPRSLEKLCNLQQAPKVSVRAMQQPRPRALPTQRSARTALRMRCCPRLISVLFCSCAVCWYPFDCFSYGVAASLEQPYRFGHTEHARTTCKCIALLRRHTAALFVVVACFLASLATPTPLPPRAAF